MIRLFVAIDIPESQRSDISSICCGLPGAKWIVPDQLHLTLRFIGEVDGGLFRDIRSALENVKGQGFPLQIKGLGCFPPRKDPRVLWVGLEKNEALIQLRKKVDAHLRHLGIESEKRKFSPHITLARLKQTPLTRLTNFLSGNSLFALPEFDVSAFCLYSSELTSKGAIHTIEAEYFLQS